MRIKYLVPTLGIIVREKLPRKCSHRNTYCPREARRRPTKVYTLNDGVKTMLKAVVGHQSQDKVP